MEFILIVIYLLAFLLGVQGVLYCIAFELTTGVILCMVFVICTCIRVDILFDKIDSSEE